MRYIFLILAIASLGTGVFYYKYETDAFDRRIRAASSEREQSMETASKQIIEEKHTMDNIRAKLSQLDFKQTALQKNRDEEIRVLEDQQARFRVIEGSIERGEKQRRQNEEVIQSMKHQEKIERMKIDHAISKTSVDEKLKNYDETIKSMRKQIKDNNERFDKLKASEKQSFDEKQISDRASWKKIKPSLDTQRREREQFEERWRIRQNALNKRNDAISKSIKDKEEEKKTFLTELSAIGNNSQNDHNAQDNEINFNLRDSIKPSFHADIEYSDKLRAIEQKYEKMESDLNNNKISLEETLSGGERRIGEMNERKRQAERLFRDEMLLFEKVHSSKQFNTVLFSAIAVALFSLLSWFGFNTARAGY